nr:sphingosine kinase 2 [Quercus suber]
MGSRQSTPAMQSRSTLDGQPVTFSYHPSGEPSEQKLSYTADYVEGTSTKLTALDPQSTQSTRTDISCQDIILIWPVPAKESTYIISYVVPNDVAKDDSSASPVLAKSSVAEGLPEAFVRDFRLPDHGAISQRFNDAGITPSWHVILSTGSGAQQARSVWDHVIKPVFDVVDIQAHKHYALHVTSSELTVSELTRDIILPQANLGVQQCVLILSGDGGMVDIVNTLLAETRSANFKKPSVSLMPLGTGNALAHSANITADNTIGFRSFWRGSEKELPVFCASFSDGARLLTHESREERLLHHVDGIAVAHGAVVASWGLHAGLVADSDTAEYRKFGTERFQMAAKEALYPADGSSAHAYTGRVSVLLPGGKTWQPVPREKHGYVLATYCSYLEKGFKISPGSNPLDGKLRLVHFGAMTGDQVMSIMNMAYQGGQHVRDERVAYQEIDGIRIEFDEVDAKWRRICIDGKIIRVEEGGWVEVRSGVKGVVNLIAL